MTYKPYKIGDFVNVQEYNVRGTVIDISMRHSIIETIERTQIIIPNAIMNKAIIENISNVKAQKLIIYMLKYLMKVIYKKQLKLSKKKEINILYV